MLRLLAVNIGRAVTAARPLAAAALPLRAFSSFNCNATTTALLHRATSNSLPVLKTQLIQSPVVVAAPLLQLQPTRSVTKFSLNKGKRKSVKAVIKRFKRLDWGIWIRTHCGRHKKLFKKSAARKRRLRQHIFTNSTQSWLLDKMVTSFWRRPKYYIDDPYAPYHQRNEFFATKAKTFKV